MPVVTSIKFIDLQASAVDWTKSDPASGAYTFKQKKYVDYSDKTNRPKYLYRWHQNSENMIADICNKYEGARLANVNDKEVYPEGAKIVAGNYTFKDVILFRIPIASYAAKRKEEMTRSEMSTDSILKGLRNEFGQYGMSDDELKTALGNPNAVT